jgi:hypothetical protein
MARGVASKGTKTATPAKAASKTVKAATKTKSPKAGAVDADLEKRIGERAYRLWEDEGRPEGKHDQHWEQARELVALETAGLPKKKRTAGIDPGTGAGAKGEPNQAIENTGEFPGLRDQGDEGPRVPRRRARSAAKPKSADPA